MAILTETDSRPGLIGYEETNKPLYSEIETAQFIEDKTFGFKVPVELTNVSREICNPIESWDNKEEYYKTSLQLAEMFQKNYNKFKNKGLIDYSHYGPKL